MGKNPRHLTCVSFETASRHRGPLDQTARLRKFDGLSQNACKVNLTIDYEFNNKILGAITSKIFDQIANTLIDDICARADTLFMKVE